MDSPISTLSNKEVSFRFHGVDLRLDLSLGLFSSFDIDTGSRLLLKTLAKELPLSRMEGYTRALDVGCGCGVLGLALQKKYPHLAMGFQDRDALAVAFASHNARKNGLNLPPEAFQTALLLDGVAPESLDLILSNIPAKAGKEIIRLFLKKAAASLREGGRGAVVIVQTLGEWVEASLQEGAIPLLHKEEAKGHWVFHFGPAPGKVSLELENYIRHRGDFPLGKEAPLKISTVYGLPNFNTLSYDLPLGVEVLKHKAFSGKLYFLNPGQGQLPCWLAQGGSNHPRSFTLASRDILQLKITEHNLRERGIPTTLREVPSEQALGEGGSYDGVFLLPAPLPRTDWQGPLARQAEGMVKGGKFLFLLGRSSDMAGLLGTLRGFQTLQDKRLKGNRGILLRRV